MNNMNEIFNDVFDTIQDIMIKLNKENWNFFTNATTENRKQFYSSNQDFINFLTHNENIPVLLKELKKRKSKFNKSQMHMLKKLKDLHTAYERKTELTEELLEMTLDFQIEMINTRIQHNSKESTTNHLADLAERETSISEIRNIHKLFFEPVPLYHKYMTEIIRLRNAYYKERGYSGYYDYHLKSHGLNDRHVKSLINKVDALTKDRYRKIKSDLDKSLTKKMNCRSRKVPSYIYGDPFFRFYPVHIDENVNIMFKGKDVAYTVKKFYEMIGVNLDSVYEVSDLYIRPGKYQNPVIFDIDRSGDIRFSTNSKSNFRGIYNLLRTLGKIVYMMNADHELPFITKEFTNRGLLEGFGMFMTNYAFKGGYISKIIAQYEDEDEQLLINISDYIELNDIIYIRFHLALAEFESLLYTSSENPAKIWMKCQKKYQMIDSASNIEPDGWSMIDSLLVDPFMSVWELEGYIASKKLEKIKAKKQLSGRALMKYFIGNLIQKGYEADIKDVDKLIK